MGTDIQVFFTKHALGLETDLDIQVLTIPGPRLTWE